MDNDNKPDKEFYTIGTLYIIGAIVLLSPIWLPVLGIIIAIL